MSCSYFGKLFFRWVCECWWGKWGFWLDWILRDWFLSQNLLFATPLLLRVFTNWLWFCEPNPNVEIRDAMPMLPMQFVRTSTYSQMWVVFGTCKQERRMMKQICKVKAVCRMYWWFESNVNIIGGLTPVQKNWFEERKKLFLFAHYNFLAMQPNFIEWLSVS